MRLPLLCASLPLTAMSCMLSAHEPVTLEFFPLHQVSLLESPFSHARELNGAYLRNLDSDRLLAGYLEEAGLEPKAEKYSNWESSGLDGHTLGHYLTALAQMAATGDAELRERLVYVLAELKRAQDANGNGYVGAVPDGATIWAEIEQGDIRAEHFSLNERWVPWYNLHKLFAGLRDAWEIAGLEEARSILLRLTDWTGSLTADLSDEQMQAMLHAEHGGMNEVFADLYAMTGDPRHLRLARRFSHHDILQPLLKEEDRLTGLHANTQIPKVIGYARIAELDDDREWREAAEYFWDTVIEDRSIAFGGNSVREHFNAPDDFSGMLRSREGPETCNTYNMLRLTEQLYRQPDQDRGRLADYYERALYNHILSSQHPGHGGFVYFTPIRPRHYRVYSQPETSFWCCVGSGIENHGKYGRFIYAHAGTDLFVNLFIPSRLAAPERGLILRQENRFPDEEATRLEFSLEQPATFTIHLRKPSWVQDGGYRLRLNGEPVHPETSSSASGFVSLTREWRDGDRLELELPMKTRFEQLPDGSEYVSILHGPIVLAAQIPEGETPGLLADDSRMGHVAPGAYLPLDSAPMLVGEAPAILSQIRRSSERAMQFTAPEFRSTADRVSSLSLLPFFRVHDTRYMLYWRLVAPEDYQDVVKAIAADETAALALEARTLDRVTPGEQQPEVEHDFRARDSETGVFLGRHWRDAGELVEYRLRDPSNQAVALRLSYDGGERGRQFEILVNGSSIAQVSLDGHQPDQFIDVEYPLPDAVLEAADGTFVVTLRALDGSRTARIFDLRLISRETPQTAEPL